MIDVFISYARADKDFVRKLHQGLEETNREIWIDWEDIPPTAEWRKEIFASIAAAHNFLFIISPTSCASEMCREELAYAEANHKRLVPVVYRPVPQQDLPPALARIQWISFSDNPFDNAFRSLVEAIDTDLDWVHEHTRLLVRAREWDARNQDASLLLRGKDLLDAERWQGEASGREPKPIELQTRFLQASVAHDDAEVSRQLATEALRYLGSDATLALRKAVEAGERSSTEEAYIALSSVLGTPRDRFILHQKGPIGRAVYSPDGRRVVTASQDHSARIWDAESGRLLATLSGHTDAVASAAFSPDGRRIVTAGWDKTACVWDAEIGTLLATLSGHAEAVIDAAFSPDGRRIVTAGWDKTACVWDAEIGHLLFTLSGHAKPVIDATFSPGGDRIATASNDHTVCVWDTGDGHLLATLSGHAMEVRSVVFSSDGERVVTASKDNTARVWDARSGRLLATLFGHAGSVNSAAFSPDGKRVVTACDNLTARIWDAESGRLQVTLVGHTGSVVSAAFLPDSGRILTASYDRTASIWDSETAACWPRCQGIPLKSSPPPFRLTGNTSSRRARMGPHESGIPTSAFCWRRFPGTLLSSRPPHFRQTANAL